MLFINFDKPGSQSLRFGGGWLRVNFSLLEHRQVLLLRPGPNQGRHEGKNKHTTSPTPLSLFHTAQGSYKYMDTLGQLDSCIPPKRNLLAGLRSIVTPLAWETWDARLAWHPDQRFRQYVVSGIRDGFNIRFDYQRLLKSSKRNMPSVSSQPQAIREYMADKCAVGHILGPLKAESVPGLQVNKFGLISKKIPGEWRLIVDLSSPEGYSVNDGVYNHLCSLKYISVDDALAVIRAGPGSSLGQSGHPESLSHGPSPPSRLSAVGDAVGRGSLPGHCTPFRPALGPQDLYSGGGCSQMGGRTSCTTWTIS